MLFSVVSKTRIIRLTASLLLFLILVPTLLGFLPKTPFSRHRSLYTDHAFGVGFDLTPSYGTVAISYPNGSILSVARAEGDAAYQKMMVRLSLKSSQHIHLPYEDVGESLRDLPRRMKRNSRKAIGLPASKDVGTLSQMVDALRTQVETFVGQPISAATITIPHLAALYGEDLHDAFEYLNLSYIEFFPFWGFRPIHSTIATYAGHGRGLCTNYTRVATCEDQERRIPSVYILALSYTRASLTASQAHVQTAYYLEETPAIEDLTLGYDARHDNANEDYYWEKVRDTIRFPIVTSPARRNVTKLLVSGESAQIPKFRQILHEEMNSLFDKELEIIDDDPVYSAARGVAELARRAMYAQNATQNHEYGSEAGLEL